MRFVAGRGAVAKSHREDAAGRSSLHGRQCGSIGKQLRVDAETPYAGRPVEKRLCRNADSETPMQQRHLGTLLHKSNAQRWVLCVPRCARNQVSKQANLRASNRASNRASKQSERARWRCWALRRGIRGGFRRLLRCRLRRLRLVPLRALAGSWSCRIPVLRCWRRGRSPERRRRLSFQ